MITYFSYISSCICLFLIVKRGSTDTQVDVDAVLPACNYTCGKSVNESHTAAQCNSTDTCMIGRCCVNVTQLYIDSKTAIIGIDLQECNLTEHNVSDVMKAVSSLRTISLEENPIQNLTSGDFHRNTDITYLSLPPNMNCPGGNDAWYNESHINNITVCLFEQNPCHVHNVTCPDNSHCEASGVDQFNCLCNEGYHGYKCMNKGDFPYLPFAIGVTAPTAVLCLVFWVTQRRYVLGLEKNK